METHCTPNEQRRRHFDHQRANIMARSILDAIPRIKAAEDLAQRLNEAGLKANPRSIPYDHGCAVLVYVTAHLPTVLLWLDHYAVPVSLMSHGSAIAVYSYQATVSGQSITLVITHREPS